MMKQFVDGASKNGEAVRQFIDGDEGGDRERGEGGRERERESIFEGDLMGI